MGLPSIWWKWGTAKALGGRARATGAARAGSRGGGRASGAPRRRRPAGASRRCAWRRSRSAGTGRAPCAALGKARALHLRGVGLGLFKVGRPDCPPAAPQRGLQALEARRLPALEREGPEGVRGRPVAEVLQGGHAPGFRAV